MRRIEKLKAKLEQARLKQLALVNRGKLIEAGRLNPGIEQIRQQIQEAEKYEPQQLGKLIDAETLRESGLSKKLVEVHLAADFLADCAMDVRETLGKLGFSGCSIFPLLKDIETRAQEFASIVCHPEFAGLSDFMTTNERFIDDMHIISRRYISDHLNITDNNADAPWKSK